MGADNPLLSDRNVAFVLYEVLRAEDLCRLPYFDGHTRETFDLVLGAARRLARDALFPAYKPMDEEPPRLVDGTVRVHPRMRDLWPDLSGWIAATRPVSVGGQQLPMTVSSLAAAYLMAANLGAYGYAGLTAGAAHLIEAFGDAWLTREFMPRMYAGTWTGTMALTEPQAGSSLADVRTRARPSGEPDGHYRITGQKVFISGGDQDVTENIVHMVLARIDGAPAGIRGVSLFAVPKRRPEGEGLVPNDVAAAGVFHKMGWRALPSIALSLGDNDDCHGWLVGPAHQGVACMFQMMNEARIMVGFNAAATASVAYHEALSYACTRPQGRPLAMRDPSSPQVPIIEHADVRRMLLRQKAIVEGSLCLLATTAYQGDLAAHAPDPEDRRRAGLLLDLLTPMAKTFPAERGFESNALAVQVHGGYGYTSEYLPEAWLRDQKLNTLHEGTTGIQSMDLLGRKVVAAHGEALGMLGEAMAATVARARAAGVDDGHCTALERAMDTVTSLTMHLAGVGLAGDREGMLLHSADYMDLLSTVTVAWQWLAQAAAAREGSSHGTRPVGFYEGKLLACRYWYAVELPRVEALAALIRSGEDSYARMQPEWY